MKNINQVFARFLIVFFLVLGIAMNAQTKEQVDRITASYNQPYLSELAAQASERSAFAKQEAIRYAIARNIPVSYTEEDGAFLELQRMLPDGTLLYYKTNNHDAAISTRTDHLNTGGSTRYKLDGQNMTAYVWDGGHPRVTHQEYHGLGGNDRVSIMDIPAEGGTSLHFHAAHVVGTIAASGVQPAAKGMAPHAKVNAYKWNDDISEAAIAASNGMLISNHSYGFNATVIPDQWFGAYQEDAVWWDYIMANAPYYLMVKSAGNDGEDNSSNGSPLLAGYDKLSGASTAKNNLVVAASQDAAVDGDGNLNSVNIVAFSSQGPTDDLRIKPDITGNGWGLYSTYASSDNAYNSINGTSMAAPNVSGSLLLLQQHHNKLNGNFMKAATLKGLALHTADDAGPTGPDAIWGWGLMNAKKAAETITRSTYDSKIQELTIAQGQTITLTLIADGTEDLMASISWTDLPGTQNTSTNSSTPALINDLDIRIQKDGTTYYPWRLTSPNTNANNGDNNKDPYERIDVQNPSGSYTLTITHKGTLLGGSQDFSLIITGLQADCSLASIPQDVEVEDVSGSKATVYWSAVPEEEVYDLRYRKVGGTLWTNYETVANGYEINWLDMATDYEVQVRFKCSGGIPSAYSASVFFTTASTFTYCDSESSEALPNYYISNVKLNTIDNTSIHSTYSDFTSISTDLIAGETYAISITTTADNPNYNTSYGVWIDYYRNEDFGDPGEQVFTMATTSGTVATGFFTVPAGLDPISTTIRVTMVIDDIPPGPCDSFYYGEVEDYSVNILKRRDFVYEDSVWTPENPNGVSTSIDNIHIINGDAVFYDDIYANNILINATATLNVEKVLTIAGNLTINGDLVFVSSSSGNGELAEVPGTSTVTGEATVQRYMSDHRSYRMVSSAVNTATSIHNNWQEGAISSTDNPNPGFGTHITGTTTDQFNGFDATGTGNPSMFTVDVANQQFVPIANTDVKQLAVGEAYLLFVRGDRNIDLTKNNVSNETILRAKGALHTGQQIQNFATVNPGDFVMFANPYQSAVDINSVLNNSSNLNTGHYYIYDPNLADHGAYVTVTLPLGTNIFGSVANQYLQPGQGAQAATLVSGNSSIVFDETDKFPGNHTITNRHYSNSDLLTVQLFTTDNFNNGGAVHDGFGIVFGSNNDNAITPADAVKPMNFNENLGVLVNGVLLSLEQREMPKEDEVFQLSTAGYKHKNYTLRLTITGLEDSFFFLQDHFTGISSFLEEGDTVYNYTVDEQDPLSIATDRFSIEVGKPLGIGNHGTLSGFHLFPNPFDGGVFHIFSPDLGGQELQVNITDLSGRLIYEQTAECLSSTVSIEIDRNMASGVYLVTIENGSETVAKRLIKK